MHVSFPRKFSDICSPIVLNFKRYLADMIRANFNELIRYTISCLFSCISRRKFLLCFIIQHLKIKCTYRKLKDI